MKLSGGARKNGNGRDGKKDRADIPPAEPEKAAGRKKAPEDTESRNRRKAKRARAILSVVLVLVILAAAAGVYYIVWVRPPEILRQRLSFLYPVEDSIPDVSLLRAFAVFVQDDARDRHDRRQGAGGKNAAEAACAFDIAQAEHPARDAGAEDGA